MIIRPLEERDRRSVLDMMVEFYSSPAILHHAPEETLERCLTDALSDSPYIEGYVFDEGGKIAGYSLVAKSYSTEYGGMCVWIEDLYVLPEFRGKSFASRFFEFIDSRYEKSAVRMRLEVEPSNEGARRLYGKCGYNELPYIQMTKEFSKP